MCSLQTAMEIHVACSKIALAGTVWRGSLVMVIDSVNRLREVPHSRPPRAGRSGNSRDGHHMLHGYSKFLDVDFSVQVALPVFLLPAFFRVCRVSVVLRKARSAPKSGVLLPSAIPKIEFK